MGTNTLPSGTSVSVPGFRRFEVRSKPRPSRVVVASTSFPWSSALARAAPASPSSPGPRASRRLAGCVSTTGSFQAVSARRSITTAPASQPSGTARPSRSRLFTAGGGSASSGTSGRDSSARSSTTRSRSGRSPPMPGRRAGFCSAAWTATVTRRDARRAVRRARQGLVSRLRYGPRWYGRRLVARVRSARTVGAGGEAKPPVTLRGSSWSSTPWCRPSRHRRGPGAARENREGRSRRERRFVQLIAKALRLPAGLRLLRLEDAHRRHRPGLEPQPRRAWARSSSRRARAPAAGGGHPPGMALRLRSSSRPRSVTVSSSRS
jgi:hypothetical protein